MNSLKAKLSVLLIFAVTSFMTGQAEKTLVKSFNLEGNQSILLDLEGDVEVQEWNNPIMRIQINIKLENANESILKALVTAGRYNLKSSVEEGSFLVLSPGLEKEVKLKGQPLKEQISYTIYAPNNVLIKMADEASTSVNDLDHSSSL